MKRVLTILLVCSLICVLCVSSFAAEVSYTDDGYSYKKTENGITITGFRGTSENLYIPTTIGEEKVTAIGKKAFAGNKSIKVVTIPQSVTTIEDGAFNDCTGIITINIYATNLNGCSEKGTFNRAGTANGHDGIGVNIGKAVGEIQTLLNTLRGGRDIHDAPDPRLGKRPDEGLSVVVKSFIIVMRMSVKYHSFSSSKKTLNKCLHF